MAGKHPRLTPVQVEALEVLARDIAVLNNQGQYQGFEDENLVKPVILRKPILKALADKGLAQFEDQDGTLLYRITDEGQKALEPNSLWIRPPQPPGRTPKATIELKPRRAISDRRGVRVHIVKHPAGGEDRAY